ncbi:MAG: tetratricopeptide repeat protein [Bacteroidaceae bacterium]|nr:tetratricopeptide repeat protein [Bacteroidaceae bacterium]
MKRLSIIRYPIAALCMLLLPGSMKAQHAESDLFVLEAHRQMMLGNHSDAFELVSHALELCPGSVAALEEMGEFWHYMRLDSIAAVYMRRAADLAPHDYWIQQPLVELYVSMGQTEDALAKLEQLYDEFPEKEDVLLMLEALYKHKGDYENVVKVLERLELKEGKSEQLSMEKFRTFIRMGDTSRAFAEMKALADEYPNDMHYRVLMGDTYMEAGEPERAIEVYRDIEAEDPDNVGLMLSMMSYYAVTNQDSLLSQQTMKVLTAKELDNSLRMRLLNSKVLEALNEKQDPQPLLDIFDRLLSMPQADDQVAELCARYMATAGVNTSKIKPVLKQILDINPENRMARSQLLQYATEEDDTMEVIRICRPAADLDIDDPVFYYYLGIAYFQIDSTRLAIDTFKKGFTHVADDTNLQLITNMYALMGDAYHKMGDMQHAYESYDSCLVYRPDEALVLNNYAYYLSLQRQKLDKAEDMSRRSLEQEPDNPTYIDTYAWILFQQKRYAEAKTYIDKALAIMADDIDADDANIIEHAGDIYARLGDKQTAMRYWTLSAQLGNDSPLLAKKLKKQKYYAY